MLKSQATGHDLRTPQVLILGPAERLIEKMDLSPEQRHALEGDHPLDQLLASEYALVFFLNGREAAGQLPQLRPDLIITDLPMPENEQFIRQLRANSENGSVPVLILTAPGDREDGARMLRNGAQDYLVTPFLLEELRARADNLIATKRAQDKAQGNTSRVEEANQELESFSYSVSHDLRAPLRAMQGLANALIEDYGDKLDATGKDYARRIVTAGKRMDQLVSDLLQYSRLARGELQIQPLSLEAIVNEARHQLEAELEEKHAQLRLEASPAKALGQPAILAQVVCNLLSNAVKFVAPGVQPQIKVRIEEEDGWVRLSVQDNGIGIPPEDHERIFRVFERLHTPSAFPGTGIGLAIVVKGIKRLGGRLGVDSAPGKGSTFWFELPKANLAS
jgi:signal transduction histidine kinase